MNLDTLKNAGLTAAEIKIYETLLDNGGQTAGQIIVNTKLKRGDCYNKIYDLIGRGLVLESTKSKKLYFELASPDAIESYIEKQIENLSVTQKEIKSILPNIISSYNLSYHKPGVKFFEGEEAIEKITRDALAAQTEILSFVDSEAVDKYMPDINKKFVSTRRKLKIKKRLIVAESATNRHYFKKNNDELTEVRFAKGKFENFNLNMQIYDNKVSYITLLPDQVIGIIIEDPHIAKLQKQTFDLIWQTSKN